MEKKELVQRICAGYCSFYKPEKDEELACKGFMVAESLALEGSDVQSEKSSSSPASEMENALFQIVCRNCSFFERDCDFAAWKRGESSGVLRRDVTPCGGFLFLGHSLEQGSMDIQTIHRVI